MMERTFVMIKPDGVQRQLVGEIIKRFENVGLKLIAMKMLSIDEDFAKKHYTEDIAIRRGEHVRNGLVTYVVQGPVIAMVWEGIHAIEVVRKIVGPTESKIAAPGTIRGDFTHMSFSYADEKKISLRNVIHASGDAKDSAYEISLWFTAKEIANYKTVHELYVY